MLERTGGQEDRRTGGQEDRRTVSLWLCVMCYVNVGVYCDSVRGRRLWLAVTAGLEEESSPTAGQAAQ